MLLFHHLLPLEHCEPGVIVPTPARLWADGNDDESDRWAWSRFVAYQWLSERIGHWPLFLHVMPIERALA